MCRIAVDEEGYPEGIERANNAPADTLDEAAVMFVLNFDLVVLFYFFGSEAQAHPDAFVQVKEEYFGKEFNTANFKGFANLAGVYVREKDSIDGANHAPTGSFNNTAHMVFLHN